MCIPLVDVEVGIEISRETRRWRRAASRPHVEVVLWRRTGRLLLHAHVPEVEGIGCRQGRASTVHCPGKRQITSVSPCWTRLWTHGCEWRGELHVGGVGRYVWVACVWCSGLDVAIQSLQPGAMLLICLTLDGHGLVTASRCRFGSAAVVVLYCCCNG